MPLTVGRSAIDQHLKPVDTNEPAGDRVSVRAALLLLVVFIVAVCGLVYELIAGALASYLLGDSVTQFSYVIGVFLTAMGVGSYLSRLVRKNLPSALVLIELAVGVIGGMAAFTGFAAFSYDLFDAEVLMGQVAIIGILVGLEIPIVVRILQDENELRVTIANVMGVDYLGAFAASLLFPLLLLPHLGLVQAGLVMGLTNVVVGGLLTWVLPLSAARRNRLRLLCAICILGLGTCLAFSTRWVALFENRIYQDEIIYSQRTRYQQVVLTRWRNDLRLYLNGHLQFSSVDEYRYHETLVHPAMLMHGNARRVLILGGGDGLAAREVLRHASVKHVDLVDLDSVVVDLFRTNAMLTALNSGALSDARVAVHPADAFQFLRSCMTKYDVILADLPDPSTSELGKLYSTPFYGLVARALTPDGFFVTQATSPFRSREAFWCIAETLSGLTDTDGNARFTVTPLHVYIPTFGSWGFMLAGRDRLDPAVIERNGVGLLEGNRYVTADTIRGMVHFPPDMSRIPTGISSLNNPLVSRFYREGYNRYLD